jgi:hypothetical protein
MLGLSQAATFVAELQQRCNSLTPRKREVLALVICDRPQEQLPVIARLGRPRLRIFWKRAGAIAPLVASNGEDDLSASRE